jgi:hypothetical protein
MGKKFRDVKRIIRGLPDGFIVDAALKEAYNAEKPIKFILCNSHSMLSVSSFTEYFILCNRQFHT